MLNSCASGLHRTRLCSKGDSSLGRCALGLPIQFLVAPVVNTHRLHDAQVGKSYGFAGTLLIEDIAAIPAVMFPVSEGEGCSTSHADVTVGPFGRGAAIDHAA